MADTPSSLIREGIYIVRDGTPKPVIRIKIIRGSGSEEPCNIAVIDKQTCYRANYSLKFTEMSYDKIENGTAFDYYSRFVFNKTKKRYVSFVSHSDPLLTSLTGISWGDELSFNINANSDYNIIPQHRGDYSLVSDSTFVNNLDYEWFYCPRLSINPSVSESEDSDLQYNLTIGFSARNFVNDEMRVQVNISNAKISGWSLRIIDTTFNGRLSMTKPFFIPAGTAPAANSWKIVVVYGPKSVFSAKYLSQTIEC